MIAAAVVAAGGLAAGLILGLGGGSLPPESANPQRDIVGSWTCTWPAGTAQVTFGRDDSETYSSSYVSAPGFAQRISGSSKGIFMSPGEIIDTWESALPAVYKVHIRGSQMTLGDPSHPAETCTRKLPVAFAGARAPDHQAQPARSANLPRKGRGSCNC